MTAFKTTNQTLVSLEPGQTPTLPAYLNLRLASEVMKTFKVHLVTVTKNRSSATSKRDTRPSSMIARHTKTRYDKESPQTRRDGRTFSLPPRAAKPKNKSNQLKSDLLLETINTDLNHQESHRRRETRRNSVIVRSKLFVSGEQNEGKPLTHNKGNIVWGGRN